MKYKNKDDSILNSTIIGNLENCFAAILDKFPFPWEVM
jgi:hypothetical protein